MVNQCDGCLAGYPITLNDNIHRLPDGSVFMCCEHQKYTNPKWEKTYLLGEPNCSCDQRGRNTSCERCNK
jgi:hypothetical protein